MSERCGDCHFCTRLYQDFSGSATCDNPDCDVQLTNITWKPQLAHKYGEMVDEHSICHQFPGKPCFVPKTEKDLARDELNNKLIEAASIVASWSSKRVL